MTDVRIINADVIEGLAQLDDESVQCCVTSPPYWGLRDYGAEGQLGIESTPAEYVERMVAVFEDVRRVLKDDGVLWLNLGDSYAMSTKGAGGAGKQHTNTGSVFRDCSHSIPPGIKPKDLVGIPWRVAFALQDDGWYLRSDVIWSKLNPMPESVTDRPTKAHEYVFLLTKSARYFYDVEAIAEQSKYPNDNRKARQKQNDYDSMAGEHGQLRAVINQKNAKTYQTRNARTVWTFSTKPYAAAHFATFPPELPERCILAGSRRGDIVLDPFAGSGTTGMVARALGRSAVLIELNPEYIPLIEGRCALPWERSTQADADQRGIWDE